MTSSPMALNSQIEAIEVDTGINKGMPKFIQDQQGSISPYEFLPAWVFYTPVVLQSLALALRYGDVRLPLVANPSIKLSGMVGESKHDILSLAGDYAKQWISPFITVTQSGESNAFQAAHAHELMQQNQLDFPIVAKPDLGCRGAGVKLLQNLEQLEAYFASFPLHSRFLLQEKAPYPAEAGVFYIRYPGEKRGKVISLTLKYAPFVTGDGVSTLEQLIESDSRAGQLTHLYFPRHQDKLNLVLEKGESFQLAFAGSHSRGSIFRNGNEFISDALARQLDRIFDDVDGFCYGRLDIKFQDIHQLMDGKNFTILEINGASSEAAHIWDRKTPLKEIFSTLLFQYRTLFAIGALQKKAGHKPPSISQLLAAWREEKQLVSVYPQTD
ncbi:hypothetical protein TUMSATVNIG3_03340 [Vibrio nigripulchritudo]|nr:hypothetical protein TUMSATVNIG2_03340 [Vibrio nigripulchritudo]BDU41536.1 hypothetical protein TUMSATVNIG3_03340 [Vibrio nigripulchritudo]